MAQQWYRIDWYLWRQLMFSLLTEHLSDKPKLIWPECANIILILKTEFCVYFFFLSCFWHLKFVFHSVKTNVYKFALNLCYFYIMQCRVYVLLIKSWVFYVNYNWCKCKKSTSSHMKTGHSIQNWPWI